MIKTPEAADEALACLADVLTKPSSAQQFLEPLQPACNSLREREDFRALMAELDQRKGQPDSGR